MNEAERARATLAATFLGGGARGSRAELTHTLADDVRAAAWRFEAPQQDLTAFTTEARLPRFLHADAVIEAEPHRATDLATAWQHAYEGLERTDPGAVIRVETSAAEHVAPLYRLAALAGADLAVHVERPSGSATWSWPLRVTVTTHGRVAEEIDAVYPDLSDLVDLNQHPDLELDVLVVSRGHDLDSLAGRSIRAGLVVFDATEDGRGEELRRRFGAFASLCLPHLRHGGWWTGLIAELAHDAPLDVAARKLTGSVLVASGAGLALTAVRSYSTLLLGVDNGLWVQTPAEPAPAGLAEVLRSQQFDHEGWGASTLARLIRAAGAAFPVTAGFAMAGPPTAAEPPMAPPPMAPPPMAPQHAAPPEADPEAAAEGAPQRAWPKIDAPDDVDAGSTFLADIGLGVEADPRIEMAIAGELPTAEDVDVTVIVDGCEVVEGDLRFTVNLARQPTRRLTLRALDDPSLQSERTIGVQYTVKGSLRAYARRPVHVNGAPAPADGTREGTVEHDAAPEPLAGVVQSDPTLVLTLQQGADVDGKVWQWTISSSTVPLNQAQPDELRTVLDDTARQFQANVVQEGSKSTGTQLYDRLFALGRHLADKLPDAVIAALHAAAAQTAPEPPSVLIITGEARIPWELAVLDPPPRDTGSPFLCGQMNVGRWVVGAHGRPAAPPLSTKVLGPKVVVVGDYAGLPTWRELPEAKAEAAALIAEGALQLSADYLPVRDVVHGKPPADLLHFATHGRFLEGQREEGFVLVDRSGAEPVERYFTPLDVEAGALPNAPVVFLNACQVGAGETILGDYAGMAAAFLRIGASAVVAPLWEVDDSLAAVAAKDFYAATEGGATVGAAVMALRARFTETAASDPATKAYGSFLAYQYFGHPNLALTEKQ